MKFYPILPKDKVELVHKLTGNLFILPQVGNVDRKGYYWKEIIVDNDYYENGYATPVEKLIKVANAHEAKRFFITLHERPWDAKETVQMAKKELMMVRDYSYEGLITLTGKSWDEMKMISRFARFTGCGVAVPIYFNRFGLSRAGLVLQLWEDLQHVPKVHFFGLDDFAELRMFNRLASNIFSVDTSLPASIVYNGADLVEFVSSKFIEDWKRCPLDGSAELDETELTIAVQWIDAICHGR